MKLAFWRYLTIFFLVVRQNVFYFKVFIEISFIYYYYLIPSYSIQKLWYTISKLSLSKNQIFRHLWWWNFFIFQRLKNLWFLQKVSLFIVIILLIVILKGLITNVTKIMFLIYFMNKHFTDVCIFYILRLYHNLFTKLQVNVKIN